MDLRRLPPSMVLVLGLAACGDDGPKESDAGPCLSIDPTVEGSATEAGSGSDSTGTGSSSSATSGDDTTFGPCLDPLPPTTGTDSGSGSDSSASGSDSGSGSGSGSGSESSGGMGARATAPTRAAALRRVLDGGKLPADVAARLRTITEER